MSPEGLFQLSGDRFYAPVSSLWLHAKTGSCKRLTTGINDTIVHLATSRMGFGGVGHSGMGSYHGKKSFDTFSHEKSVLKKSTRIDMPVRYMPYTPLKDRLLRVFLR